MGTFLVGVQVPPLAPRSFVTDVLFPVLARSRLGRIHLIVALVALVLGPACTPGPKDAAASLESALRASETAPSLELLDALTPASRALVDGVVRVDGWKDLRLRLQADLKGAVPDPAEDAGPNVVLRRPGGPGLLLVRDGHGWRLDLPLAQATSANLREAVYPAPW